MAPSPQQWRISIVIMSSGVRKYQQYVCYRAHNQQSYQQRARSVISLKRSVCRHENGSSNGGASSA